MLYSFEYRNYIFNRTLKATYHKSWIIYYAFEVVPSLALWRASLVEDTLQVKVVVGT